MNDGALPMLFTLFFFICLCISQNKGASGLVNTNRKQLHIQEQQLHVPPENLVCKRISSSEAASMVTDAYNGLDDGCKFENQSPCSGLLLITSDASRGAKRFTGITSILREIQYRGEEISRRHSESDRVTIATRRMHSQDARDVSKSEVAAVALGIRAAMNHIPAENRRQIIFLTDSTSVLDYYCVHTRSGGKQHISSTLMNDPHFKAMRSLLQDAKENASDDEARQTLVFMAKVKSNKMETDGFFDHDAADIISSLVKSISNKEIEKIYVESANAEQNDNNSAHDLADNPLAHVFVAPSLRLQDLEYLSESELKSVQVKKPQVVLKRERGVRLARCRHRMMDEFGVCDIQ
jgi:hypothetical protein